MKRILVWHLPSLRGDSGSQGPVFYADHDYTPGAVRLYARQATNGGELLVDIRTDGESIFTSNYAVLNEGANLEEHAEDYPSSEPLVSEGSVVSLHVIQSGGAEDITCSLELESLSDDDVDESE